MKGTAYRQLGVLPTVLFAALAGWAQITNVTGDQAPPIAGAGHDYIRMLNETVNPGNGAASVRIGTPLPKGRGPALHFSFGYDSNAALHLTPQGWKSNGGVYLGAAGWSYQIPQINYVANAKVYLNPQGQGANVCDYFEDYMFTDLAGGSHPLRLLVWQPGGTGTCPYMTQPPSPNYLTGADEQVQAVTSYTYNGVGVSPPVTVADMDGTVYSFSGARSAPNTLLPDWIEDRNGNKAIVSGQSGAFSFTDSAGRIALSVNGFGSTGNTVTVSGLPSPSYQVTWGTTTAGSPQPLPFNLITNVDGCGVQGYTTPFSSSISGITQITLPNGQSYKFQYDPTTSMLNKLTYPSGGYVRYVWGPTATYWDALTWTGTNSLGNPVYCAAQYGTYVVQKRFVSFDGVHEVLEQDFAYNITWNNGTWTSRQTTVTTKDFTRSGSPSFQTIYTYAPFAVPSQPEYPYPLVSGSGSTPMETQVQYFDTSGSLLRTVQKAYTNPHVPPDETVTLDNGQKSQASHIYLSQLSHQQCSPTTACGAGLVLNDQYEYDYGSGAPGTLLKRTHIDYASFNNTPIFSSTPSILDRPLDVITYDGNGNRVAETDYVYDQSGIAPVSPLPTGHDETNYGSGVNTARGNATTKTQKCFPNCTDAVTASTYDETGRVTTIKDPNGNLTQYSYADSYTSGTPPGNTNAYLTKITHPVTNGVAHVESLSYGYADGQLTASTDQNKNKTSYIYSDPQGHPDPLGRLMETDYPDGGMTTLTYTDTPGSVQVVTQKKLDSSSRWIKSTTKVDGVGQLTQAQSNSDPAGTDYADTVYDGLGRKYTISNPYRSTSDPTYGLTTYSYDALGRVTQVKHPDSTLVSTTFAGRAVQVSDEGNGTKSVQRVSQSDALGRLLSVCEVTASAQMGVNPVSCGQDIAATGFLTTYSYDTLTNLLSVSQGSLNPRTFTYNSLSQLITATNPESGKTCYGTYDASGNCQLNGYDGNGNLLFKTAPAPNQPATSTATQTITYCYDALNRMTGKAYSLQSCPLTSPAVTFNYDETTARGVSPLTNTIGRRSSASTAGASPTGEVFSYDPMGRMLDNSQCTPQNCGTAVFSVKYQYDLLGDMTSATNGVGTTLTYSYNSAAQLSALASSLSDINHPATLLYGVQYNPLGAQTAAAFGNTVSESRTYAPRGWLQSLTDTTPNPVPGVAPTGSVTAAGNEQTYTIPGTAATPGTGSVTISGSEAPPYRFPISAGRAPLAITTYTMGGPYPLRSTASQNRLPTEAEVPRARLRARWLRRFTAIRAHRRMLLRAVRRCT